ncbi:MAG: adenosylcobinamide-GDP ribazoletransferase [Spirochaetia bacterium]|nr:adenosylcobinamide-GDP ribazoletransferase [Spirochaetia bacterium]
MYSSFLTALRTLTVFNLPGKSQDNYAQSLIWFPAIGFFLSLLFWLSVLIFKTANVVSSELIAVFILLLSVIFTRGLHLDGLADWADGFFGAYEKNKILAIMKDTHIGVFGMIALLLIPLIKLISIARLIDHNNEMFLFMPFAISRTGMVLLAVFLPYARSQGTGYNIVTRAKTAHFVAALMVSALTLYVLLNFTGVAFLSGGMLFTALLGFWFYKKIGGVTGDLLGASNEIIETLILFFCAILIL